MSAILNSISELEKELILLEGTLHNIMIFDIKVNELVVNLKFESSENYDHTLIGGLTGTINEFGGIAKKRSIRTIKLEKLKLIFSNLHGLLVVFAVEPEFTDDQFRSVMFTLLDTYEISFKSMDENETVVNETAITTQLILSFLSEELPIEMILGPVVQIYPYKMREIAEKRAAKILGSPILTGEEEIDPENISTEEFSADELQEPDDTEIFSKNEALYHLLDKFVSTFSDALQVTLIRFTSDGSIHKITAGTLEDVVEQKLYNAVLGMINTIIELLSKSEDYRTLDLEDKWIYFQFVSHNAFLYITVESKDVLGLIRPLVERISQTISNLFPEDE